MIPGLDIYRTAELMRGEYKENAHSEALNRAIQVRFAPTKQTVNTQERNSSCPLMIACVTYNFPKFMEGFSGTRSV